MLGSDFTSTKPPRWFRPWWRRRFENQTVEEPRLASSTPSQTSLFSRPGSSGADDTPGCRKRYHPYKLKKKKKKKTIPIIQIKISRRNSELINKKIMELTRTVGNATELNLYM